MLTNNEYTIEELKAQYRTAEENQKKLKQQIEQKEKEEKELKEAALAKEKAIRKKAVDDSVTRSIELIKAYTNDFGVYFYKSDSDNSVFSSKFWNSIY